MTFATRLDILPVGELEEPPNCEGIVWSMIKPTVVPPMIRHRFTIIFCHGRGSTGSNFQDEVFESKSSKGLTLRQHFPSVKWVFPSAGLPYDSRVSVEYEAQWFAVSSLKDPDHEQIRQRYGLSESMKYLHQIINQEIEEINGKTSRVILGGSSQGCAAAIHALLSTQHRLNSFVGFCSWLPFSVLAQTEFDQGLEIESVLQCFYRDVFQVETRQLSNPMPEGFMPIQTPCFLSHNADDDVVDVKLGRSLRDGLRSIGMKVTWDEHEHGDPEIKHWINEPAGIDNLVAFLQARMGLYNDQEWTLYTG